jgi:hypothetical protein
MNKERRPAHIIGDFLIEAPFRGADILDATNQAGLSIAGF